MTSSRTFAARNTAVRHNHSTTFCLESTKWQIYFKIGTKKLKINAFKCWKWQHKWNNYMIRSYSFQNSCAFPMACATFETTAQKTLGTLACSAIYNSFSWNASLPHCIILTRAWPGSQPNAIDRGGGGRITPPRLTPKPMTAARRARRRWKGLGETVLKHS